MSTIVLEPLPRPLFPVLSARVMKEGLSVISATLMAALVALTLAFWTVPETLQEATPRLPVYEVFP